MAKFISGFLLGAFLALILSPYVFPYGFPVAAQHWTDDLRDALPVAKTYFVLP